MSGDAATQSPLMAAFIAHGLGARWEDAPEIARRTAKTFILDTLGVGVAGAAAAITAPVRRAAALWSGPGPCHIWGAGAAAPTGPVSAVHAAFVNGFQIHCQEFDCVHEPAVVHPMATIFAALMAETEQRSAAGGPVSGRELMMAALVAVDCATSLGVAATAPLRFFRPAAAGVFGATLGVSRLRGFSREQTTRALGVALGFCSGAMQAHTEGKPTLPLQIANAARSAIMAADVAEAGLDAPRHALEGPFGYLALFEQSHDIARVLDEVGQTWRMIQVSHKPFPTGRAAQGGVVLMQRLREDGVRPELVETITLTAPPLIERLVGRPLKPDMDASYARLCFAYTGAVALSAGAVTLQDFTPHALAREHIHALGAKITVVSDGGPDPAAFTPQTATAVLTDGRQVTVRADTLFGAPEDPLSPEQNIEKFRECIAFGFGEPRLDVADVLIAAVESLDQMEDAGRLSRLASGRVEARA